MKTPEELEKLKKEYDLLSEKLKTLSEDELKQVTGGVVYINSVIGIPKRKVTSRGTQVATRLCSTNDKELPNIDEDADENRDTVTIGNLLKENLDMWKSEGDDNP